MAVTDGCCSCSCLDVGRVLVGKVAVGVGVFVIVLAIAVVAAERTSGFEVASECTRAHGPVAHFVTRYPPYALCNLAIAMFDARFATEWRQRGARRRRAAVVLRRNSFCACCACCPGCCCCRISIRRLAGQLPSWPSLAASVLLLVEIDGIVLLCDGAGDALRVTLSALLLECRTATEDPASDGIAAGESAVFAVACLFFVLHDEGYVAESGPSSLAYPASTVDEPYCEA